MQRYFLKDGDNKQGPFTPEELSTKITPDTLVCAEGTEQWTAAGTVDELKQLFAQATAAVPPPVTPAPPPVQRVEEKAAVQEVKTAPAATMVGAAAKPAKKSTAWLSYVLALLVLGGAGYYVYQDMQKNKDATEKTASVTTTDTHTATTGDTTTAPPTTTTTGNEINTTPVADTNTGNTGNNEVTTTVPVTTTTNPPTTTTTVVPTTTVNNDKAAAAAKKKAEDDKKKLAAAEAKKKQDALLAKKKEEEQKKLLADQMNMRNNWPRYVTIGALNYEEHDGIKTFPITVSNAFPYGVEKVTLRVDYIKKEGKNVGTETLVISNLGARSNGTVMAGGNKKAKKANVYITGINSRGLHFCFPVNNGNNADPYFCN